ncbi:hypothetical protein KAZ01_02575 [Candidatus Gracilibacteria bacterium]|nr:hypothetical protein [Candidatus Gracilibacteria bacterium]
METLRTDIKTDNIYGQLHLTLVDIRCVKTQRDLDEIFRRNGDLPLSLLAKKFVKKNKLKIPN